MLCLSGCEVYSRWVPLTRSYHIQLNLSTTATLGTEESDHCKEVAVVERF